MAKKNWKAVVNDAIAAYKSKKYVYFYGAKAIILTDENMDYLISAEPKYFSRYSKEEIAQIKKNSKGKIGVDCSGFVGWVCTGDKQYSAGQIANCTKWNTLKDGPTASILFTSWGGTGRHIGLDIGNGVCLQAGYESTDANIKAGRAGIFLSQISETAWEKSGESAVVDYTGAYSPYEPTTKLLEEIFGVPDKPVPMTEWVGEAYGAALIPVYATANVSGKRCSWANLATGNLFDVIGEKDGFYNIRIAGTHYGYIQKQYVLRKTPQFRGKVVTSLYVRQNAGTGYKKIGILYDGEVVDVCDVKKASNGGDWYYILYKDGWGFCSARYVKKL